MKWLLAFLVAIPMCASAITARSYIITEMDGTVIAEKNADDIRPIASITKLWTAERATRFDQQEEIQITLEDVKEAETFRSPLRVGEIYTRELLIELALISSDNIAAIALARNNTNESTLFPTIIVDGCGLNPKNVSSARSIAVYARHLYPTKLAAVSVKPTVLVGKRIVKSTNKLINRPGWKFYLSKTGWMRAAGGCLVVIMEMNGTPVTIVLLGATSVPQRWKDLYELRKKFDDSEFAKP